MAQIALVPLLAVNRHIRLILVIISRIVIHKIKSHLASDSDIVFRVLSVRLTSPEGIIVCIPIQLFYVVSLHSN